MMSRVPSEPSSRWTRRSSAHLSSLALATALLGCTPVTVMAQEQSATFTINHSPGAAQLMFADRVLEFTTPFRRDGAGPETAILNSPDNVGTTNPNVPGMVDFGGGDIAKPWAVTVGFPTMITDVPGPDIRVFSTQLNTPEGWSLSASADGIAFTSIGTFVAVDNPTYFSVDIDLNGTVLPQNARYLRFVGTQVPISTFTYGFDFDAVGIAPPAALKIDLVFPGLSVETPLTQNMKVANVPLGADFSLVVKDQNNRQVSARFAVASVTPLSGIEGTALFPGPTIFKFSGTTLGPDTADFMAVHLGEATISVTPTGQSPVFLRVKVGPPLRLGNTALSSIDNYIINTAHRFGIPPQFLKAQVAQESPKFDTRAFRYEPLNGVVGDFKVSRGGMALRADGQIGEHYRLAAKPDILEPAGLPAGDWCLDPARLIPTVGCVDDLPPERSRYKGDFSSVRSIVDSNPKQNWKSSNSTIDNYKTLKMKSGDFTPQTGLASSYGLLQVMWATAATTTGLWNGRAGDGQKNPSLLFDSNTDPESGSLVIGSRYLANLCAQKCPVYDQTLVGYGYTSLNDVRQDFVYAWAAYNGKLLYGVEVLVRVFNYEPVPTTPLFRTRNKTRVMTAWTHSVARGNSHRATSQPVVGSSPTFLAGSTAATKRWKASRL